MEGLLIISENNFITPDFYLSSTEEDFSLEIRYDKKLSFLEQITDNKKFKEGINETRNQIKIHPELGVDSKKGIDYVENNFDNLLNIVNYISLDLKTTKILDYIKENPVLLTKNIIIPDRIGIKDYDKVIDLIEEYKDIVDNIYVHFENNSSVTTLKECLKTIKPINDLTEHIKNLDLSPMEKVMYVYDMVRNRVYNKESKTDNPNKSRDLSEVLFGENIVCLGYAQIFNALLNNLGIKNDVVYLDSTKNENEGHARNVAYIKDKKYNIDGVYYFDATWNSKIEEGNNSYLKSYKYFAKTKQEMDKLSPNLVEQYFKYIKKDITSIINDIKSLDDYIKYRDYIESINTMSYKVSDKPLMSIGDLPLKELKKEKIIQQYSEIYNKFNKKLDAETMILLLNNVRKKEYYENPSWYPYTMRDLYTIFVLSNWSFSKEHLNSKEILIKAMFGKIDQKPTDIYKNYSLENNIYRNNAEVKLTKVLQLAYNKKNNK